MIDRLAPYLPFYPYFLAGWLALSLLLLIAALISLQLRRRAEVWRTRHTADRVGRRLLGWAVTNLVASLFVSALSTSVIFAFGYVEEFFPPRSPYDVAGVAVAALASPSPQGTVAPTWTPFPTVSPVPPSTTPSPTITPAPTLSQTPSQTPTPSVTPSPTETLTPLERLGVNLPVSARPLPTGANIRVVAVTDEVTETNTPADMARSFPAGVETLYYFVSYQEMADKVAWGWTLSRNGLLVEGDAALWNDGENGAKFFELEVADGYPPGDYTLRLYLGQDTVNEYDFTVNSEPEVGP